MLAGQSDGMSQSPIGVVKRNHALNSASRIENACLARTKSSAGFPRSQLPDLPQETRVQRRVIQRRTSLILRGFTSMSVIAKKRCVRQLVSDPFQLEKC